MTSDHASISSLIVVARGEASSPQSDLISPAAKAAVRYADPIAWTAAVAVGRALASVESQLTSLRHATGLITISAHTPAETIDSIAKAAGEGFSSPLRYPAANPGSFAGVCCIAHGFRGPTMNLTMPPLLGLPVAMILAASWLKRAGIALTAVATCGRSGQGQTFARCILLAPESAGQSSLTVNDTQWLSTSELTPQEGK